MYITLLFIGLGLAMDAFSVAVSNGMCMSEVKLKDAFNVGIFFGAAQGIMPVLGYFGGIVFSGFVESVDHWIVFIILLLIGIKMITEALEKIKSTEKCFKKSIGICDLFFQAIATSIDAFAVGIGFAAIDANIFFASVVIMVITFLLSAAGVFIGKRAGIIFRERAEIFGGLILIFIGIKILAENLFF